MRSHVVGIVFSFPLAAILALGTQSANTLAQPKGPPPMGPAGGGPPPKAPVGGNPSATLAQLGKQIFFDQSLSIPAGMACASCHSPATGFTFPNSNINAQFGTAQGAVAGRFGPRKVPTISYSSFSPKGPMFNPAFPGFVGGAMVGGQFWDGRAEDLVAQAPGPMFNANEMNNFHNNLPAPDLVVQAIAKGGYAKQFQAQFGADVFTLPPAQVIPMIAQAVAAWESTPEVSPFNSKYDQVRAGQAVFSPAELNGLRLATGSATGRPGGTPFKNARCSECHSISPDPNGGPDLWTSFVFANIGVPRNAKNPFYTQTDSLNNPLGFNPLGINFVDYGLGASMYPKQKLPAGNIGTGSDGRGDFLAVNGKFKTPTLRNADKRPAPGFVKAYFHNGGFKSLDEVVRFYNTRNLTTKPGEVIDFTRPNPYQGLSGKPLWPTPEVMSPQTLQNPRGLPGQIGNLGLTPGEEANIVAFIRMLSDGP